MVLDTRVVIYNTREVILDTRVLIYNTREVILDTRVVIYKLFLETSRGG